VRKTVEEYAVARTEHRVHAGAANDDTPSGEKRDDGVQARNAARQKQKSVSQTCQLPTTGGVW
jgi:hypothetical protein